MRNLIHQATINRRLNLWTQLSQHHRQHPTIVYYPRTINTSTNPTFSPKQYSSPPAASSSSSSKSNSYDRLIVLGMMTLTGLLGLGFGTRAQCKQSEIKNRNTNKTLDLTSSDLEDDNQPTTMNEQQKADTEDDPSDQQAAFNPETGEINWDCPCLGGMAHGVCGEQFKAAFSCFVYSEQEPKGVECIEKFKQMQDCFKEHPDVYGPELTDTDEQEDEAPASTDLDLDQQLSSEPLREKSIATPITDLSSSQPIDPSPLPPSTTLSTPTRD